MITKLLEDMKMLQVNFTMICIIHNISLLFESNKISKCFLRSIIDFYFFLKKK